MNCFSRGREVNSLCKSVPRSSVTKYLQNTNTLELCNVSLGVCTHMSSKGDMKISLRLITWELLVINLSKALAG